MSRIQQLVRPQRRGAGGTLVLPLVGLVLAGAAFYAHARMVPAEPAATPTTTSPAVAAPVVASDPLPAPKARPGARVLPVAASAPAKRHVVVAGTDDDEGYALVRRGEDGYTMSGDTDDADDIEAARRSIDGDFLWFRRDGKAWVVRDAGTVAEARAAWAATEALSSRMQGFEARMQPHVERMEALGRQMEAISMEDAFETPEVRAAMEALESVGERIGPLAAQQVALAMRMEAAGGEALRATLEREHESLERRQEALQEQMEAHGQTLASAATQVERMHAPIEALARQMEAAAEPMEAVGEEMEALGERIGEQSRQADARVRTLIDQAWRSGQAQPAPTQQ